MKLFTLNQVLYSALILSLLSIGGSLYFSEVVGLIPCVLCWYQRICIYPMPILITVAILKPEYNIIYNLRILSFMGLLFAGYQYFIQFFHTKSQFCHIGISCSDIQIVFFRFITLPLLSFISFIIIFLLCFMIKESK